MAIGLAFQKSVEFSNPRLTIFYYTLLVGTAAGLAALVFVTDMVYREVPVGQHLQFSMWVTGATPAGVEQVVAENLQSDFCQNPEQNAYQWDAAGEYIYDSYRCYDVCRASSTDRSECLNPKETYLKESPTQIFFATEIEDTWDGQDTKYRFVPMTEALGIQFTYQFAVPMGSSSLPGGSRQETGSSTVEEDAKSEVDNAVLTVMLDAAGEVLEVIKPAPFIDLPLTRMMEIAGDRNRLEAYSKASGPNYLHPDGSVERDRGPSYRISGSEIVLNTNCYNKHLIDLGPDPETGAGYVFDHVCYMTASFRDSQWVSAEETHLTDQGRMLHRYFHGVRVSIQPGGSFRVLDEFAVFAMIVDVIVLLGVPAKFVLFIMLNCLGTLSKIYNNVLCEPFYIMDEIGSLAVRMMGQSEWFVELEDKGDVAGGGAGAGGTAQRGISRKRMEERLKQALMAQGDKIDSQELRELVDVCFTAITKGNKMTEVQKQVATCENDLENSENDLENSASIVASVASLGSKLKRACTRSSLDRVEDSISLGNFIVACSINEVVEVDSIIELFDRDRSVGLLERVFMPREIANRGQAPDLSADEPSQEESPEASAGLRSLTLEQRKALSLKNELKIQEFTSWKDKEAAEAIKAIELLQLQVSQMTEASIGQPFLPAAAHKEANNGGAKSTSLAGVNIVYGCRLPGEPEERPQEWHRQIPEEAPSGIAG